MSIDALSWAFNLELPSSGAKLTLLALANYANESGEAFPSQKAMSLKTCLCERAIRTHLVTLEGLGIITRVSRTRANGSYTTDLFKLNVGAEVQRQNLPAAESANGKIFQTQRQILPNPAAEYAAPYPSLTTTITNNNQKHTSPSASLPNRFQEFWETWPATDRRVNKSKCLAKWKACKLDAKADEIISHVTALKKTDKWQSGYEPAPLTYLNGKQWEDGLPTIGRQTTQQGGQRVQLEWFLTASGIEAKAVELGITKLRDEVFPLFKERVYEAAGITEDMLRKARIDAPRVAA